MTQDLNEAILQSLGLCEAKSDSAKYKAGQKIKAKSPFTGKTDSYTITKVVDNKNGTFLHVKRKDGKEGSIEVGGDYEILGESEEDNFITEGTYEVKLPSPWNSTVKIKARTEKEARMRAVKAQGVSSGMSHEKASMATAKLIKEEKETDSIITEGTRKGGLNLSQLDYVIKVNKNQKPGDSFLNNDGEKDLLANIIINNARVMVVQDNWFVHIIDKSQRKSIQLSTDEAKAIGRRTHAV